MSRKGPAYDRQCTIRFQLRRVHKALRKLDWKPLSGPLIEGDVVRVTFQGRNDIWRPNGTWTCTIPIGVRTADVCRLLHVHRRLAEAHKGTTANV
jgi:hypothetical protein